MTGTLAPVSRDTGAGAGDPLRVSGGVVGNAVATLTRAMGERVARMHLTVTERRVGSPRSGQEETRAKRRRGGGAAAAGAGLVVVGLALVHALRAQVCSLPAASLSRPHGD